MSFFQILLIFFLLIPSSICQLPLDAIKPNQPIRDGDVLVSSRRIFALGFFSPGKSEHRYVGVWFNNVPNQTIVWVANRDNPVNDSSGVLSINGDGGLVIHGKDPSNPLWSANVTLSSPNNSIAKLLDTGNLVLLESESSQRVLWQGFDYPTDTVLSSMKVGLNRRSGLDRFLTSWKTKDDPGTGSCTYGIDPRGIPQLYVRKGGVLLWRSGPWIGDRWSGVPDLSSSTTVGLHMTFVNNENETWVMYIVANESLFRRGVVDESGRFQRFMRNDKEIQWTELISYPSEWCDNYEQCGPNSNCDPYKDYKFACTCLPGFEPKSPRDWDFRIGAGGCVRKAGASACRSGEGFVKVARVKVPDSSAALVNMSLSLKACELLCLKECSCMAYTSADEKGDGCVTWHGDLMDTRTYLNVGQDLYVRVDAASLRKSRGFMRRRGMLPSLILAVLMSLLLIVFAYWWILKRHTTTKARTNCSPFSFHNESMVGNKLEETRRHSDLQIFDLSTVIAATEDFSLANKLGEGGFGSVYMGKLANGQKIAVKRLSTSSTQGIEEFKNEVTVIAKLQHRNLVKLLGCCIEQEEKLLIYEYLPNKSLDYFLFDQTRRSSLDWRTRFDIIIGVARGILYLHQDSRLRIIHRDLKTSNVLLDDDMKPKISDFGLAKIFNGDLLHDTTNRVVGTFGYMSPEYAVYGKFSTKSDVFGFGVILLEIVSGKKNNASYQEEHSLNLIGHVWDLWRDERVLDIVDSELQSYETDEVLRCIQIGLLCLQEDVMDRPSMSEVVLMLSGERALASPQRPAFVFKFSIGYSLVAEGVYCSNNLTITNVIGR